MNQDSSLHIPPPPRLTAEAALFLDFDGTLVEIATTPEAIRVEANLGRLLQDVAQALDGALAVVSGRAVTTIDRHLNHAVRAVAGIHGAVRRTASGKIEASAIDIDSLNTFREKLEKFAQQHDGVLMEDKDVSLALHFRGAPQHAAACQHVIEDCAARSQGELVCLTGKMVVELKPAQVTKADAITAYMREAPFHGRQPVFAGDDVTDESGFSAVTKMAGYGVIIGDRLPTAALARLATVSDLHNWLRTLCAEEMK